MSYNARRVNAPYLGALQQIHKQLAYATRSHTHTSCQCSACIFNEAAHTVSVQSNPPNIINSLRRMTKSSNNAHICAILLWGRTYCNAGVLIGYVDFVGIDGRSDAIKSISMEMKCRTRSALGMCVCMCV